jgi:hypothetical protein
MLRKSRVAPLHDIPGEWSEHADHNRPIVILTAHTLLTEAWTGHVRAIETAIRRFKADRPLTNDCQVVMFEMADDRHLHVNVMHKHPTAEVSGWAGPGRVPFGVVHNRRFGDTTPHQIIRHIRDMVFAARSGHATGHRRRKRQLNRDTRTGRQRITRIAATDVIRTR